MKKWKKVSEKIFANNKFWTYKIDNFLIDEKFAGEYHYVQTRGSSMVIPLTSDNRIILTKQYRYLNDMDSIEFPCGGVEEGFSIEENAIKELREETGYSCNSLTKIGYFAPYSGVADEICYLYLAKDLFYSPLKKDFTEDFEIDFFTSEQIEQLIENNTIWDGMTLAAWMIAKNKIR